MTEFAVNNNKSIFTRLLFFFALKNLYPHISFDLVNLSDFTICKQINKKKAINISKTI